MVKPANRIQWNGKWQKSNRFRFLSQHYQEIRQCTGEKEDVSSGIRPQFRSVVNPDSAISSPPVQRSRTGQQNGKASRHCQTTSNRTQQGYMMTAGKRTPYKHGAETRVNGQGRTKVPARVCTSSRAAKGPGSRTNPESTRIKQGNERF